MSLFGIFKKAEDKRPPAPQPTIDHEPLPTLPEGFATSVMDLEMKLEFEQSYTLQAVQQLNELYRIAIEYFINVDPRKAEHFQRKLTTLLTNPKNKSKPNKVIKNNVLEKQVGMFNSQADVYVRSMLQSGEEKYNSNQKLIRDNLHKQESDLKSRIEERSRSKKKKRMDRTP